MATSSAPHITDWSTLLPDGRLRCDVCPRECALHDGQRGLCFVRAREGDHLVLTTYGRSTGFCIDPIEKKPLYHFLPGSPVLSFGTAGCNLACRCCQNWEITKSRDTDRLADAASPERIAEVALAEGCRSVAFTYNDPVVYLEYAIDTAIACHELGLRTVAVSAGYVHPQPRRKLFHHIDAANIDLKGFSDEFYRRSCGGHLRPVLDTLDALAASDTWLEVTTLLIPGRNDDASEVRMMCRWLLDHLGPEVPLHFTAFHPDFRMLDVPPTPLRTLTRARQIALDVGLRHVYTGNVDDPAGGATHCTGCGAIVIRRHRYHIDQYHLSEHGACTRCGTVLPGVFDGPAGTWGARRRPIRLSPLGGAP